MRSHTNSGALAQLAMKTMLKQKLKSQNRISSSKQLEVNSICERPEKKMSLSAEELRKRRRYVKHCFNRIRQQPFVHDVLVFDVAGVPLRSTMDRGETIRYTGLMELLIDKAKLTVRRLYSADELKMIRIKTNKFELVVTQDEQLFFMVFQKPVTER